ncbi:hypothetical protein TSUD_93020 [Trifolium subterraneum]|uniref:F-box/LRR-repeat protein 15/At3g58940/PEG3-like LRR domain-containing protein n=1 Tax=Trifolium subterraneum TaxID=3900 RepID=A0A2Z6NIV8_TRISU|nr:hypothetical protein TSUD_93020 [Trifolium subterraneum]
MAGGGTIISSSTDVHEIQRHIVGDGDMNDMITGLPEGLKFTLHIPSGICFPSLKKLDVSDVIFANENSVQQLFSGCPVLQELELYNCDWKNIQQINVAISTLRMLRIRFVKIDAVNLISLCCTCNSTIEFIPVNLTSLVAAYIDLGYHYPYSEPYAARCLIKLLRGLGSVKSLKIYNNTLECLSHAKGTLHLIPSFHNLTHLYVYSSSPESTNGVLLDILRKTPNLEVLTIPGVIHCSRHFSSAMEKLTDVCNQLEDVGLERCVIKFLYSYYESSDDEDDEDEDEDEVSKTLTLSIIGQK